MQSLHRAQSITLLAVVTLVSTLATPAFAGDIIEVQKEKQYAEPTAETAVVYFVRPAFLGKAVKIWAFVDDQPVGANKGEHYTLTTVSPGKHLFWADAENISALEFEVEAGKTYYLKQAVRMGGMKARVKLLQIDEAEGQAALEKCKFTRLTDEGQTRGREIVAKKHGTAIEKAKSRDAEDAGESSG